MTALRKSWADRAGIKTGVVGEIVDGVRISDDNRVTVFEYWRDGIEVLQSILHENYKRKGVNAVLFGLTTGKTEPAFRYAIYVSDEFMGRVQEHVSRYIEEHGEDPVERVTIH